MEKIKLNIVALSHSVTQSHNYAVVLGEENGNRRLPIVIGGFEAQAIAVALESMSPNRPLTHDLFKNTLSAFDLDLKEIVISNLIEGVFYATLVIEKDGEVIEIDSRTSDAIAMAVRFKCPIYTLPFIMESAGVVLDEDEESSRDGEFGSEAVNYESEPKSKSITDLSTDELENKLNDVLAQEDYEQAALIRDEINRRNEN